MQRDRKSLRDFVVYNVIGVADYDYSTNLIDTMRGVRNHLVTVGGIFACAIGMGILKHVGAEEGTIYNTLGKVGNGCFAVSFIYVMSTARYFAHNFHIPDMFRNNPDHHMACMRNSPNHYRTMRRVNPGRYQRLEDQIGVDFEQYCGVSQAIRRK